MSNDFSKDIYTLYTQFGFQESVNRMTKDQLKQLLDFRIDLLIEELSELIESKNKKDNEEVVDALIDLVVVAIGTLELFQIDSVKAWNEVLRANSEKQVGKKKNRSNPFNMPDLIKHENWIPPNHEDNHGILSFS